MTSRHHHNFGGLFSTRVQSRTKFPYNFLVILCCVTATLLVGCWSEKKTNPTPDSVQTSNSQIAQCGENNAQDDSNTITAEVVALEQIITFNRFGAFNPAGMVYALRKDVVYDDPTTKEVEKLPLPEASKLDDPDFAKSIAGRVSLKSDKRPRPLVLRVNECNYLQVKFWNLLSPLPTIHTRFERADFPQGGVQRHSVQNPTPLGTSLTDISSPPRCLNEKGEKVNNAQNCANPNANLFPFPRQEEPDYPTTRAASIHVNGLDYANIESDGANVGKNPSSLAEPGTSKTYTWYTRQEGGYFFYSAGALAGGEGDGGQLGLGLFGSVNVEPQNSVWYRSQVTHGDLTKAKTGANTHYDDLDYKKLAILDADNQIVHSDLNAIIYQPNTKDKNGNLTESGRDCLKESPGSSCGMSFREFTTIFHDENKVFQAFAELSDEGNPISAIADGMAINYGSSGAGSVVLANRKKLGPGKDCPECKLEEFFLSSWVNGDPAMIVQRNMDGKPVKALYPDDPSNVHHSYLGDPVRFRNIHAGPKETHVFHLHAHQWLQDKNDPNANYLDSQTISPGSSYTYDIQYGGGGNRNLTVGDAIFHCHLYPHFAAGMWELWRNHDVFEDGKPGFFNKDEPVSATNDPRMRNLPDYELADKGGAPNPAIVPIPGYPLAPLSTKEMRGYPFFMDAVPGHRPPQPPLDMARDDNDTDKELNGGLPRHVITGGSTKPQTDPEMRPEELLKGQGDPKATKASRYVAERTWKLNSDPNNLALAQKLDKVKANIVPQCGSKDEILAMAFHAGWNKKDLINLKNGINEVKDDKGNITTLMPKWCTKEVQQTLADLDENFAWQQSIPNISWPNKIYDDHKMNPLWTGKGYDNKVANKPDEGNPNDKSYNPGKYFRVNGYKPRPGAPFAEPCPATYYEKEIDEKGKESFIERNVNADDPRLYKSAYIQFDLTVNKYGWHDPQARMPVLEEDALATIDGKRLAEPLFFRANSGDCIQFQATNLIPGVLNLDDFQVYTPTDTIGQHIHLVKFDVTSSDGSANGWNYEDGTFAPDEVRERIDAIKKYGGWGNANNVKPEANIHPALQPGGSLHAKASLVGKCPNADPKKEGPWCGAQTTVQRWWADPVLNDHWKDRTMRAVFTHDHYGPSSHQQHGFYAALIVEPKDTVWTQLGGNPESVVAKNNNGVNTLKCALPNSPDKAVTAIGKGAYGGGNQGKPLPPCRQDGGPTSYAANIGFIDQASNVARKDEVRREYNLAFADFAILYNADLRPVNPPSRQADLMLPHNVRDGLKPKPEGISTEDPGTRLLNYRNEPIPLRIASEDSNPNSLEYHQKLPEESKNGQSDMANVFSSVSHSNSKFDSGKPASCVDSASQKNQRNHAKTRLDKLVNNVPNEVVDEHTLKELLQNTEKSRCNFVKHIYESEPWRDPKGGDPSSPVLATYIGEPLKLHLIQGAQEEQHVFSMTGMKWLAEPESKNSGYMNGQQIGISEHFEFDVPVPSGGTNVTDYWYGSPAVENMWDGMWGLVRSYGFKEGDTEKDGQAYKLNSLQRLPNIDPPPLVAGDSATCPDAKEIPQAHQPKFFIGAWLASDLLNDDRGLVYNERFDIHDPNAIVFVKQDMEWFKDKLKPEAILLKLQERYAKRHKKIEPLILRVHAGDCATVHFANYLPSLTDQDVSSTYHRWSYNFMPPIVNGFNFNQIQMSSKVAIQPQLLQNSVKKDLPDIGTNQCMGPTINPASGALQVCNNTPSPIDSCREPTSISPKFTCSPSIRALKWYAGDVKFSKDKPSAEFKSADSLEKALEKGWVRYTPIEFGAVALRDFGDVIKHSSHSAIGALIVEPRNAVIPEIDPLESQASADIQMLDADQSFREFVLLLQDDLSLLQHGQPMPNHRMADDAEDTGQKGFNYRTEPLWARNGVGTSGADFNELNQVDYTDTLSSYKNVAPCLREKKVCSDFDPETPIFEAPAGTNVRFRVVHPGGHSRQHAFVLHGHNWDYQPWKDHSTKLTDAPNKEPQTARVGAIGGIGPSRHLNILAKAGGEFAVPGDYLFRVQEQFQFHGGLWGVFRVNKP